MRLIDGDKMTADLLTVDPQYETMIQWCLTVLDAQPTIEERKRGKWIFIRGEEAGNALYECSECGKGDIHAPEVRVSYCWNCGADMRGDSDEA